MTWKFFLTRLRHFLAYRRRNRRRSAVKPLPDRRKRVFDFEPFEDRAHMEPPVTSLAATAVGLGLGAYAVQLAVANSVARAEAPDLSTPAEAGSSWPIGELGSVSTTAALVLPHAEPEPTFMPRDEAFRQWDADAPSAGSLSDPPPVLPAQSVSSINHTPAAEEGGGGGAEPGQQHGSSTGPTSNYSYSTILPLASPAASGSGDFAPAGIASEHGAGLNGAGPSQAITPSASPPSGMTGMGRMGMAPTGPSPDGPPPPVGG